MGVSSDKIVDIATQLNTAIPGSPTADSINERIKALDDEAYEIIVASVADVLSSTGLTNVVNVTEEGILLGIYCRIIIAPDGSPVSNIEIVVDGGATRTIPVYNGAAVWVAGGVREFVPDEGSSGAAVNDIARILCGTKYLTSLRVGHNIATATATVGNMQLTVLRGVQL